MTISCGGHFVNNYVMCLHYRKSPRNQRGSFIFNYYLSVTVSNIQ